MNVCSLIGRLTRDPELRYTPNTNQAVITFTIAVDKGLSREKKRRNGSKEHANSRLYFHRSLG